MSWRQPLSSRHRYTGQRFQLSVWSFQCLDSARKVLCSLCRALLRSLVTGSFSCSANLWSCQRGTAPSQLVPHKRRCLWCGPSLGLPPQHDRFRTWWSRLFLHWKWEWACKRGLCSRTRASRRGLRKPNNCAYSVTYWAQQCSMTRTTDHFLATPLYAPKCAGRLACQRLQ